MQSYCYENMYPEEFKETVRKTPVFLVPTGLLEWHGNHLPLGLDALKAHGICCRIAQCLGGGVVLPPNYLGRPGFSSYLGTLTYSESLVNGYFYELFGQLKKVGARIIFVLTGHYGPLQVDCLERVGACFARENPEIRVIVQPEYQDIICHGATPADHAGLWETSIFRHLAPQLTRMEALDRPVIGQKTYHTPPNDYYHEAEIWEFVNDVQSATEELGMEAVKAITDRAVKILKMELEKLSAPECL